MSERLLSTLTAAGLPVVSAYATGRVESATCPVRFFLKGGGFIRTDWATEPTIAQETQAAAIVESFDPSPTAGERLDAAAVRPRVPAALAIRLSTAWAGLSVQRKARVQAVIDEAAATFED